MSKLNSKQQLLSANKTKQTLLRRHIPQNFAVNLIPAEKGCSTSMHFIFCLSLDKLEELVITGASQHHYLKMGNSC
jgi:hypothetical protein